MIPGLDKLPIVGDVVDILDGNDNNKTDAPLGKALEKVAEKDPDLMKELAFALSETLDKGEKGGDDGKMPKELEGLLKGALDVVSGFIPGGNIVKGILGKIF